MTTPSKDDGFHLGMDLTDEQRNTAMQSPEHMKRWAEASGRKFLVFNTLDLIDALPWPDGIDLLIQMVSGYRDHRRGIDTGWRQMAQVRDPRTGNQVPVEVKVMRDELLSAEECEAAVAQIQQRIVDDLKRRAEQKAYLVKP